jgi:hypothetical protein
MTASKSAPFGEDRSPLDDCAAGRMGSAQSRHQRANRVVVHLPTIALAEVVVPIVVQPQRLLRRSTYIQARTISTSASGKPRLARPTSSWCDRVASATPPGRDDRGAAWRRRPRGVRRRLAPQSIPWPEGALPRRAVGRSAYHRSRAGIVGRRASFNRRYSLRETSASPRAASRTDRELLARAGLACRTRLEAVAGNCCSLRLATPGTDGARKEPNGPQGSTRRARPYRRSCVT